MRPADIGGIVAANTPRVSPDGRTIVVCSERANLISAVWRMNRHGGSLRRLTDPDLEACWPDYSPDGSRILISDNSDRPQRQRYDQHFRRMGTGGERCPCQRA